MRKDELNAQIEEEKEQLRLAKCEREKRLQVLQDKKQEVGRMESIQTRGFSLFAHEESLISAKTKGEKEKEEWSKLEKQFSVGLLKETTPWYAKAKKAEINEAEEKKEEELKRRKVEEEQAVQKEAKKSKSIEEMRQDRLRREKRERQKAEALMNQSGDRYSSQYNPQCVRRK